MKMKSFDNNFVNTSQHIDETTVSENNITSQNIDEDPLGSLAVDVHEPSYYKLERVVFAEPIEHLLSADRKETGHTGTFTCLSLPALQKVASAEKKRRKKLSNQNENGEITFIDNVVIKKRAGRRNKYFMDIKDGLNCPQPDCTRTFATTTLLKAHIRKVHCATTKFICEECGAGFTAAYLLRRHSAVHSGRKVQCSDCGQWLSERTNLSLHRLKHTASRPHACTICHRRFLRLSSLKIHIKFVHRDGNIACDVCDARFSSRTQWNRHRTSHATKPCGTRGINARHATHKH